MYKYSITIHNAELRTKLVYHDAKDISVQRLSASAHSEGWGRLFIVHDIPYIFFAKMHFHTSNPEPSSHKGTNLSCANDSLLYCNTNVKENFRRKKKIICPYLEFKLCILNIRCITLWFVISNTWKLLRHLLLYCGCIHCIFCLAHHNPNISTLKSTFIK